MKNTVQEAARSLPVYDRADVLVVGGGSAGTAAALAAARQGARTILLERYGYLGGLASGGQVAFLPKMGDGNSTPVGGIMEEWLECLARQDGLLAPPPEDIGREDPQALAKWSLCVGMVRGGKVCHSAAFDPELLKVVLAELLAKAGVITYHHCLVCDAVMEDEVPQGVIMETKEGRCAILADRIIDATGDGDLLPYTKTAYEEEDDPAYRNSMVSEIFRVKDCDNMRYGRWRQANPGEFGARMKELQELVGYQAMVINSYRNDVGWINNFIAGKESYSIRDVSETEFMVKRSIPVAIDFLRQNIPGYENCRLLDIATFGVRHSRRVKGVHRITHKELMAGTVFSDTIYATSCFSNGDCLSESLEYCVPYGSLIPEATDNLLVAGRCFSSDLVAHSCLNLIPYCVMTGQAAGLAAAMSLQQKVQPRHLPVEQLQAALKAQGVVLPKGL